MLKPIYTVQPMSDLSPKKRKIICGHNPPCDTFLLTHTNDETIKICRRNAVNYGYGILKEFAMIPEIRVRGGWTKEEVMRLDRHLQENDTSWRGCYRELAKEFNKTPKQIKDKIRYLRKKGERS